MNCYVHEGAVAVGVCKSCAKAVCRACGRDLEHSLVCSESCAAIATGNHEMTARTRRMYGIGAARKTPFSVIVWTLFALFFLGWGVVESVSVGRIQWFPVLFGAMFCAIAVLVYRRAKDLGLSC